jgi:L-arabinokinase
MSVQAVESGVFRSIADPKYQQVRIASLMGREIINQHIKNASFNGYFNTANQIENLCDISLSDFNRRFRQVLPIMISGSDFLAKYGASLAIDSELNPIDIDLNFTYPVQACTAHPIEEHRRVQVFEQILQSIHDTTGSQAQQSKMPLLTELMLQSHVSYSHCGLGTLETDELVDIICKESLEMKQFS